MLAKNQNKLLSLVTFITSLGDYISLFAVLFLIHKVSGSTLLAAYAVPIKSLGVAFAGATFPFVASKWKTRAILVWSQLICFLLMASIAIMAAGEFSSYAVLGIFFFQSILKQYFEAAREHASKKLGEVGEQRSLQAQILQGLYSAQFVGPIISYFLIAYLPITIPIWIDAFTFLVAGIMSMAVLDSELPATPHKLLAPLKYLGKNKALLQIFLLRSVGYWIPVGIFNYLLFVVIQKHYGVGIENSAWVYSVIGLGSMTATLLLRSKKILANVPNAHIAFFALVILACTRIAFINLPTLSWAILILAVAGLANGLNAVATQSLRRQLTSNQQFPEVVGLELIIGKLTDWFVATLCAWAIANSVISYAGGVWLSAILLLVLGVMHLSKELRGK